MNVWHANKGAAYRSRLIAVRGLFNWARLFIDNAQFLERGNPDSVLAKIERDKARRTLAKAKRLAAWSMLP